MGVVPKHARGRHGQNPRIGRVAKRRDLEPIDFTSLQRKERSEIKKLNKLYAELKKAAALFDAADQNRADAQSVAAQSVQELQKECRKQLRKVCAHTETSFDSALLQLPLIQRVFGSTPNWQPRELKQKSKGPNHEIHPVQETANQTLLVPVPTIRDGSEPASTSSVRIGQAEFRTAILDLYGRCAVTGCRQPEAIDAAHIVPFVDERSHVLNNGLALRADIHRLYDSGLLFVTPQYEVLVSKHIRKEYASLDGKHILLPENPEMHPDKLCLAFHMKMFG